MFERVYRHQLDAKNRMRIPAKFKEDFKVGEEYHYTFTLGTGGCIYVFPEDEFDKIREDLKKVSPWDREKLKAQRDIIYTSSDVEEDAQGRVMLPQNLRTKRNIIKEIVIVKNIRWLEIWSAEAFDKYMDEIEFDDIAATLMEIEND